MKTFKSLVKPWDFTYINSSIEDKFTIEEPRSSEYKLYHFDKYISSEDAIKEMEKEGYSPATLSELLSWKDWNKDDLVIALGSGAEVGGYRRVPYLIRDGSERGLDLYYFDGDWYAYCRFLAVRNLSSVSKTLEKSTLTLGDLDTLKNIESKLDRIINHLGVK